MVATARSAPRGGGSGTGGGARLRVLPEMHKVAVFVRYLLQRVHPAAFVCTLVIFLPARNQDPEDPAKPTSAVG